MGALHGTRGCDVMMIPTGILLPESIFQQAWFFYLAAFVAFNTIVFVGLSLAKLVMWPRPRIPDDTVPLLSTTSAHHHDVFPGPDINEA